MITIYNRYNGLSINLKLLKGIYTLEIESKKKVFQYSGDENKLLNDLLRDFDLKTLDHIKILISKLKKQNKGP